MTDNHPADDSALPKRSLRVSDELWKTAMTKARSENFTLSQVLRKCLTDYIKKTTTESVEELLMRHSEAMDWIAALEWWIRRNGLEVPTWGELYVSGWPGQESQESIDLT